MQVLNEIVRSSLASKKPCLPNIIHRKCHLEEILKYQLSVHKHVIFILPIEYLLKGSFQFLDVLDVLKSATTIFNNLQIINLL